MAELISHRHMPPGDPVVQAANNGMLGGSGGYTNPAMKDEHGHGHHSTNKRKRSRSNSRGSNSGLMFKDVSVVIGRKQILHSISGVAKVGEIMAIMGPSGAGKSTLLNVLGGRTPPTSGLVMYDGEPVTRKLRRKISYVLQADVFYRNITLRETLTYAMLLRLPDKMPHDLKIKRMNEVVEALELNKCIDTKMGDAFVTGLSGGERKRASIACELLTNPRIIILDEPTSGLDAAISYSLMLTLTRYAQQSRKIVVTTIHSPSSQVFYMFTNVLLITDGHVAYYGPASKVLDFFSGLGLLCQPHYNPADFILEQVKSTPDVVKKILDGAKTLVLRDKSYWSGDHKTLPQITDGPEAIIVEPTDGYRDGELRLALEGDRKISVGAMSTESAVDQYHVEGQKWPTGFLPQYLALTKRSLVRSKDRYLSKYKIGQMLFVALCCSLIWARTDRNEKTARDRLGILFFVLVYNGFLPTMEGIFCVYDDCGVFIRERASGIYRLSAFYLAVSTSEIPATLCVSTVFVVIVYFATALMEAPLNFFGCLLMNLITVFAAQGVGIFLGVLIRDQLLASIIGQCFVISTMLAAGFYNTNLPSWISWIKYLSYITYGLHGLAKIEFQYGDDLLCNDPTTTAYPAYCSALSTNGTAIGAWSNTTELITTPTRQIPGVEFLNDWKMRFTPLYADYLVIVGFLIVFRVAAYVVLRIDRPGGKKKSLFGCFKKDQPLMDEEEN